MACLRSILLLCIITDMRHISVCMCRNVETSELRSMSTYSVIHDIKLDYECVTVTHRINNNRIRYDMVYDLSIVMRDLVI